MIHRSPRLLTMKIYLKLLAVLHLIPNVRLHLHICKMFRSLSSPKTHFIRVKTPHVPERIHLTVKLPDRRHLKCHTSPRTSCTKRSALHTCTSILLQVLARDRLLGSYKVRNTKPFGRVYFLSYVISDSDTSTPKQTDESVQVKPVINLLKQTLVGTGALLVGAVSLFAFAAPVEDFLQALNQPPSAASSKPSLR